MLYCKLCEKENLKMVVSISWKKIDEKEYEARKEDGRTTRADVCEDCYKKLHNGRPPLGLKDLNEIARRKKQIKKYKNMSDEQITEEYYKEHGY